MPNDFVKAKLVLLGDSGVGKSCLIKRYVSEPRRAVLRHA